MAYFSLVLIFLYLNTEITDSSSTTFVKYKFNDLEPVGMSSYLISSIDCTPKSKLKCFALCATNPKCAFALYKNDKCYICDLNSFSYFKSTNSANDSISLYIKKYIFNLIHYWPLNNNLIDLVGGKNLTNGANCGFTADRLQRVNNAIYLNTGYYILPSGVYFNGDFTLTIWIKLKAMTNTPTFFEVASDSINIKSRVTFGFYNYYINFGFEDENKQLNFNCATSSYKITLNIWTHLALVFSNFQAKIYANSSEQAVYCPTNTKNNPSNVVRSSNFVGRTNYQNVRPDIQADLDEIKIFNRGLILDEIQSDYGMN